MRGYRTRDLAELKATKVQRTTLSRIWRFLRPWRGRLSVYLLVIVATAAVGAIPPLLVRDLIDHAIPGKNMHQVDLLAGAMVALALGTTALSLVSRWFASAI